MTSSDFNQSLLFLETIMASCANALSMTKKISGSSVFTLKHQDQCLVTMSCKTLNIALKLSKLT